MTLPSLQRTRSAPTLTSPQVIIRKKSLFNLRQEPITPQLERKHKFRKRSNTRTADEQLLTELRQHTRDILSHQELKSKEKAIIEQILEIANTPDNLLILLRQFIKDPALRELLAPQSAFKKLQGIPEILILPSPDVKGFDLEECKRMFVLDEKYDEKYPLNISVNGFKIDFVSNDPEAALRHFLTYVNNAGWIFQNDEKEKYIIDILNERTTRVTKLLQAACIHAPGDAIALFRLPLFQLKFTRLDNFPIECFIHSDQRFCVIHRFQYRIDEKTELLLTATNTYDHGEWTSALYITNIKGEPLKVIDDLQKLRMQQQEPASVDHLFAKHPTDLPLLLQVTDELKTFTYIPECLLEVRSVEELYVVKETFVHNRALHKALSNTVSKEQVRALSTYRKTIHHTGAQEKGPAVAAMEYLLSDHLFMPLEKHLLTPLKKEYTIKQTSPHEHAVVYRLHAEHFTMIVNKRLTFFRNEQEAWSCTCHGAVTYLHGRLHAYIVLTDISPFKHHHEKQHLEAYFKNYEKACIPPFFKKSA